MRLHIPERITKANHPEMPDWAEDVFEVVNSLFEHIYRLGSGNISFTENTVSEIREIPQFPDDTWYPVAMKQLKRRPIGVVVIYCSDDSPRYELVWKPSTTAGEILLKIQWLSTPSTAPTVNLLIIGR